MIQAVILTLILSLLTLLHPADALAAGADLDQTLPACDISYDPVIPPSPALNTDVDITVRADDSTTGGSGILAINLFSPAGTLIATSISSPLSYNNWRTSSGTYTFSATATDTVGNTNPSCVNSQTFTVDNIDAWIQTTGGDIHSNTSINTPGGP